MCRTPRRVERVDERPGRGDADNVEAVVGERLELRTEQQLEADVGRRHVRQHRPRDGHVVDLE